jgi:hypothetical protein
MKNFVVIVKSTDGKLDKYQDFDIKSDADAHVATHGGFVVADPGGDVQYWVVNASAKTVAFDKSTSDSDAVKQVALSKIIELEAEVTPRRLRDSVLTSDGKTWLTNKESEVAEERAKL